MHTDRRVAGTAVRTDFIRHRIEIVDQAWADLVNATNGRADAIDAAHKWVVWRKGATATEDTLASALPELGDWVKTYEQTRNKLGNPPGAPVGDSLLTKLEAVKEPGPLDVLEDAAKGAVKTVVIVAAAVSVPLVLILWAMRGRR